MPSLTIGTAGHVDHGKSALVEALTGTHPDRLIEEQERGMTIDLGFAFMPLSDGTEVPVIDVPGHERFLKTMVAGVSGIHLVLFVVAADEGIMPQTVEHLGTVRLMGIEDGIIVLTKCDLVDEEWLLLVEDDVRRLVTGTFLEAAPVCRVSSVTGEGIPELKAQVERSLAAVRPRRDTGLFRLPIDRAFTMKGFGTIVAGTVASGSVGVDDPVELLPGRLPVRIRGLQTHSRQIDRATAGQRAALNLANVKVTEVERGHELSVPGYLVPTLMLDARLQVLDSLDAPLANRMRIRLHKGTAEVMGRVLLLDRETLEPGETGYVQFRLEGPVVAERYERFIIRGFSSMRLLGGGQVLDVYPQKHRRFRESVLDSLRKVETADPPALVEQVMRESYGTNRVRSIQDIVQTTNLTKEAVAGIVERFVADGRFIRFSGGTVIHRDWSERLRTDILDQLGRLHAEFRLKETLSKESVRARLSSPIDEAVYDTMLRDLARDGQVELVGSDVRLPGHVVTLTPQEQRIRERMDGLLLADGAVLISMTDLVNSLHDERPEPVKAVLGYLFDQGVVIDLGERLLVHRDTLGRIRQALIEYLTAHGTVRASEFKDYLNISRSHATVLLDYFCDHGLTHREAGTHRLANVEA